MTNVVSVLKKIEELEGSLAELYSWLSTLFSDNQVISSFFFNLSLEEKQHKDIAAYQVRVIRRNPLLFDKIEVNMNIIEDYLVKIKQVRHEPVPTKEEALKLTLDLENSLCEKYYALAMRQSNKEFASVINALASACKDHYSICLEIAEKHILSEQLPALD